MADNPEESINVSPFPPLKWSTYAWAGQVVLDAWKGFQSRLGPYGSVSSETVSDGTAYLDIEPLGRQHGPSPEQAAAYQHLLNNQENIRDTILQVIFIAYPSWQDLYGYDEEEAEEYMPDIKRVDDLKRLIGLAYIHILDVAKDDVAYLGFEFGCTWDDEHGLGVLTHMGRVVEIGQADTSFLAWIAERDAGLVRSEHDPVAEADPQVKKQSAAPENQQPQLPLE